MKTGLICGLVLLAFTAHGQNTISLATHDQPPLSYADPNGSPGGIAVVPVLKALDSMRVKPDIQFMPWVRAQELTKDNRIDGFFAASRNSLRDTFAVRSEPIAWQEINWYLLRESPLDPTSPNFKKEALVCSYQGANMLTWLLEAKYRTAEPPIHPDQLFLMLLGRRFDACLANSYNYDNFIAQHPEYEGRFKTVNQSKNELYIYFSRDFITRNPGFLDRFNGLLRQ